jgi:hypothetical protein
LLVTTLDGARGLAFGVFDLADEHLAHAPGGIT